MSKIDTLVAKMSKAREQLAAMESQYDELRLAALRKVEVTKRGETVTLTLGTRELKVKRMGVRRRWRIWEGKTVLVDEYVWGGIHDIRFMLATGKI
jgi:hypothetical protein